MAKIDSNATSKALFKNTGIIAIGQISTKILNFLLLPLYTALLTKDEYGLVDVLTTYTGFIAIIVSLQMTQAAFRFLVTCRNDEAEQKSVISTICISSIIVLLLYSIGFILVHSLITLTFKWFLLFHVISTVFLQLSGNIARGLGRNADYATGNFLSAATAIILNVIVIGFLHLGVKAMLVSYIIGHVVGCLYISIRCNILKYVSIQKTSRVKFNTIIHYSLPLVPSEISWGIIHVSDRMVVTHFISLAANGLIAVASRFSAIYTTAFSVFNSSWTEQVVLHYRDEGGKDYITEMFNKIVCFFATIAIGIIASMPFVFNIFVNQQFAESYTLIPLYMIAVFFNAAIGMVSSIYHVNNDTKKAAISTIVAASINLVVDLLLIKHIGLYAAPVSSICGYATISIWRIIDINKRYCHIAVNPRSFFLLLCILGITLVSYYVFPIYLQIANLILVAIFAWRLNKSFLKEIRDLIVKKA